MLGDSISIMRASWFDGSNITNMGRQDVVCCQELGLFSKSPVRKFGGVCGDGESTQEMLYNGCGCGEP